MQGNDTESSVIAALESLTANPEIDVICIVRGGGSKTDLNYFDSEALCRAVANCHIPVFTGIGHEIDKSLLDEVASVSCITPTDCAKRLVERATEGWNRLEQSALEVVERAKEKLTDEKSYLTSLGMQLQRGVVSRLHRENAQHIQICTSLKKDISFIVKTEFERLDRNEEGLRQGSRKILDLEKSKFDLTETRVKAVDPQTIIARGYTLTLDSSGNFVRNAKQLKEGDVLKTKFSDGSVESRVTGVHSN